MIRGERIACTGTLNHLTRKQFDSLVYSLGGVFQTTVTRIPTLLVVGKRSLSLFEEDLRSVKMKRAIQMQEQGVLIRMITEEVFWRDVSLQVNQRLPGGNSSAPRRRLFVFEGAEKPRGVSPSE